MRLALCQFNPTVGDLGGNATKILAFTGRAAEKGADLAIFPELCITGYPPMDLLDRPAFIADAQAALRHIRQNAPRGLGLIVGLPVWNEDNVGKRLHNVAILIDDRNEVGRAVKALLPTYDVFDESRHFEPAKQCGVLSFRGTKLGLHVCEDLWNSGALATAERAVAGLRRVRRQAGGAFNHLSRPYTKDPIDELAEQGARLFINISASPFSTGHQEERARLIAESSREHNIPFVYVNQVGANTELVFDGDSRIHAPDGKTIQRTKSFEEDLLLWDTDDLEPSGKNLEEEKPAVEQIREALVLGIRDYVKKTGDDVFPKALVGLSGGIDSAVTCALAVEALGPERVVGVTMPSTYSSSGSIDDSGALAKNLGLELHEVPITPAMDAFDEMLESLFEGTEAGTAEENIQARTRGVILMAISNKFGYLLLSTSNKSEAAVGYTTLYGDMSGGLAVISDVFKTEVYDLAEHINERADREIIPKNILTKPPSAELRPGQLDQDSLPPYDVLDTILERYIEEQLDAQAIIDETKLDEALVHRIVAMVDQNEYKRRQAPPGLRVSSKAFGVGRRLPIVMRRSRPSIDSFQKPD